MLGLCLLVACSVSAHDRSERVVVGPMEWKVNSVQTRQELSVLKYIPPEKDVFFVVSTVITNTGTTTISLLDPILVDLQGAEYTTTRNSDVVRYLSSDFGCNFRQIESATSRHCMFVYDLARGDKIGWTLIVTDFGSPEKTDRINLGTPKKN